jgi:hypothetical protein
MPTSTSRKPNPRLPLLITTVSCCGIVALGWFLGAAPALEAAALSSASAADTEAQNVIHRATLATLKEQESRIDTIRADVLTLRQEIPTSGRGPDLLDQMSAIAAAHDVSITKYAAEEPVSPLAIAVAAQPATVPADPATEQPAAPTAPTEAELAAAVAAAATAPSSRLTTGNLYAVPISLTLMGTPENARSTLGDLQHGTRLFLVTSAEIVSTVPAHESLTEVRGYAYVLIENVTR